ncbi:hypothetical protein M5K25_024333 [Dendrobium thyrsiflorum]|uniref:Uncharacterized protein n=1 Tax=Dendrobium thyrsiflorum TaxID=117978 RepID=A0ABD0U1R0_DENTH
MEVRRRVVIRQNSSVRRWSDKILASGGDPAKLRHQAVVRRWSRRSLFLLFFSSCLGSPLMGNEGPIYSFLSVAWPVNKGKIRGIFGVV